MVWLRVSLEFIWEYLFLVVGFIFLLANMFNGSYFESLVVFGLLSIYMEVKE